MKFAGEFAIPFLETIFHTLDDDSKGTLCREMNKRERKRWMNNVL